MAISKLPERDSDFQADIVEIGGAAVSISPFLHVPERAKALGCRVPDGLAILPIYFETAKERAELAHEDTAACVRTLFRQAGLPQTYLEHDGERFDTVVELSSEWIGPTIFVSGMLLSHNPECVAIAVNVISSYLTEIFKGSPPPHRAKLSLVVEKTKSKSTTKLSFDGPVSGLTHLPELIQRITNE